MYNNGYKLSFFEQGLYRNYRGFERAMRQLFNANIIKIKSIMYKGKYIMEYSLTGDGIIYVEEIIEEFIKSNM